MIYTRLAGADKSVAKEANAKGDEPGSPREPDGPSIAAHPGEQSHLLHNLPHLLSYPYAFIVCVLCL